MGRLIIVLKWGEGATQFRSRKGGKVHILKNISEKRGVGRKLLMSSRRHKCMTLSVAEKK